MGASWTTGLDGVQELSASLEGANWRERWGGVRDASIAIVQEGRFW